MTGRACESEKDRDRRSKEGGKVNVEAAMQGVRTYGGSAARIVPHLHRASWVKE
jgi:hypothetical protein